MGDLWFASAVVASFVLVVSVVVLTAVALLPSLSPRWAEAMGIEPVEGTSGEEDGEAESASAETG